MNKFAFLSIQQLQQAIASGEVSSEELIAFFLDRFEKFDGQLGSALEVFDQESIQKDIVKGGVLKGIPGLIKDNIALRNRTLTCASKILEGFVSPYDATVCERLRANGATFIGRANMDEFAMGSSTETSAYQKTKNPWDLSRVPGGSSGGSAAAVAAGLVPWALGSDTGGSVRQPAAFCGIVGFKPTYGRVSRFGLVAYGSSLDQIGTFTRTVADSALLFSLMAGCDERDSTTLQEPTIDYVRQLTTKSLQRPVTIGVVKNAVHAEGMDAEVTNALDGAIKQLEAIGCAVETVSLPTIDYSAATYFIISRAEAASNLARFDGVRYGARDLEAQTLTELYKRTRGQGFGAEIKKRILTGSYVLSAGHSDEFYQSAQSIRQVITQEFVDIFKEVDLLFMPTHPAPAFKFGAFDVDKLQMDLQDYFTCPINLAGVPAISVPCGLSQNMMPIGMQLVAPHGGEELLFQVAHCYEQSTDWHLKNPRNYC